MLRDRLSALAAAVLVLTVVATSALGTVSTSTVSAALDANWRGAYDLLVRPVDQDLGLSSTAGLVESNFVALSGRGGITADQLAVIRKIADVEVAAPIGLIGQVGYQQAAPVLDIPDVVGGQSVLSTQPELYRLTYTLELTDAGGSRTVQSQSIHAALRRQTSDPNSAVLASDGVASTSGSPTSGISFVGPALPAFTSSVIAVDPAAEMKLLGDDGAFLAPLAAIPSGPVTAKLLEDEDFGSKIDSRYYNNLFSAMAAARQKPKTPLIPLLVNTTPASTLRESITIEKSTKPLASLPDSMPAVTELAKTASFRPIGQTHKDLTDLLVPFATGNLELSWPGHSTFDGDTRFSNAAPPIRPMLVGRPAYHVSSKPNEDGRPAFVVKPEGVVAVDGSPLGADTSIPGVQAYRTRQPSGDELAQTSINLPIAGFSLDEMDFGQEAVNYAPLGAYDPARTQLLTGKTGTNSAGHLIVANPSGLDFISGLPGAITTLAAATTLRGQAPIDAVRVRLKGIDHYGPDAETKVAAVAGQIAQLGLAVTVVAGSSPQPVNVYVPEYKVAADGKTSDLGWVRQDWTTLGAAATVSGTLTTLNTLMVTIAVAVACISAFVGLVAGGRRRRSEQQLLTRLGWRKRSVLAWQLGPPAIVFGTLIVLTVVGWLVSGRSTITLWSGVAASLAYGAGASILLITASRRTPRSAGAGKQRRVTTSPGSIGVRTALGRPGTLVTRVLAWACFGTGIAALATALTWAKIEAGPTRLAGFALSRSTATNLALAVLTVVCGLIMLTVARRIESAGAQESATALRLSGWQRRDRAIAAACAGIPVVVPGCVVAAVLAWALASVAGVSVVVPIVMALIACLILSAGSLLADVRGNM